MNGCLGGRTNETQTVIKYYQEIRSPAEAFVLIDEHEGTIDDAHFLVWPFPDDRWVNLPTDRHSQGCNLSFADGHAERWQWKAPKNFNNAQSYWKKADNDADLADLRRLQAAGDPKGSGGISQLNNE